MSKAVKNDYLHGDNTNLEDTDSLPNMMHPEVCDAPEEESQSTLKGGKIHRLTLDDLKPEDIESRSCTEYLEACDALDEESQSTVPHVNSSVNSIVHSSVYNTELKTQNISRTRVPGDVPSISIVICFAAKKGKKKTSQSLKLQGF